MESDFTDWKDKNCFKKSHNFWTKNTKIRHSEWQEARLADSTGHDEGDNEDQVTALNFNEGRSDCLQCKEECMLWFASEASMKNSIALG